MNAQDVMKREQRRYSVIHEVAKALDEIAALEADARKQAELIIAEAESKAAQIVADALNEAQARTDEVKAHLAALEDIARNKASQSEDYIRIVGYQRFDINKLNGNGGISREVETDNAELKPIVFGEVIPSADGELAPE